MQRFPLSLDDEPAQAVDGWIEELGHATRCEAARDLLPRRAVRSSRQSEPGAHS